MIRRTASAFALMIVAVAASAQATPAPAAPSAPAKPTQAQVSAAIDTLRLAVAAARKQTVAENMNLTPDEATRFWPVYDAYRTEMMTAQNGEWTTVQQYAHNYTTMNDSVAKSLMATWMASRHAQMDLKTSYLAKFAAAVPYTKVARFYQIENKLDLMLGYERSKAIPLVK